MTPCAYDFSDRRCREAQELFRPENDPRFRQVVGRQLDLDLVARDDADEMFSHLAGDVREDVALPGEIDAEHGARQHLGYRAFGHDLRFFRHARL
jgi:hypothetical protein